MAVQNETKKGKKQAVWKNSMSCCDETRSLPDSYFPTYFEMIFRGLRAAPVQESRP